MHLPHLALQAMQWLCDKWFVTLRFIKLGQYTTIMPKHAEVGDRREEPTAHSNAFLPYIFVVFKWTGYGYGIVQVGSKLCTL